MQRTILGWTEEQWRWAGELFSRSKPQPTLEGMDALHLVQHWWQQCFPDEEPAGSETEGWWISIAFNRAMAHLQRHAAH